MNRMAEALVYLSSCAASREQFRSVFRNGSDMLLDGVLSKGYAEIEGGLARITDSGRRALRDMRAQP